MYDQIARFYDLSHADLTADIGHVVALAREANGRVLELGCGSGRLLLPLAEAGIEVVGVDNSAVMLARAELRLAAAAPVVRERAMLVEGDMTTLALPGLNLPANGRFSLIVLPYNTAMHLDSEAVVATLRAVRQVTAPGGRLFIDVINPTAMAATPNDQGLALEAVLSDPETSETIVQLSSSRLDEETQTLHITWIYDASPADGGPVTRTVARGAYHYRYSHQWELLLQAAGWRLSSLSGGYEGELYGEESERLLLTAVADNP